MSKFLVVDSGPLMDALLAAAGVRPEYVSRMILDLKDGSPGRLYLETYADDEIFKIELPQGFQVTSDHVEKL